MRLSFKSNRAFSKAIEKKLSELKDNPKATLHAPIWLRFVEFGTASFRADNVPGVEPASNFGITGPGQPYIIKPKTAESLKFEGSANTEGFAEEIIHPGITPHAPVRKVLFQIRDTFKQTIKESLSKGFSFEGLRQALMLSMEKSKALISQSINQEVPDNNASQLFDAESKITQG
jgi:hypothetical protein